MRCMSGGSQNKSIVSILVIFAVWLSSDGHLIGPVWGAESETKEIVFSLDVEGEPLKTVLQTIYKQTGYDFLVTAGFNNIPITIKLINTPLMEGLNRIIKSAGISSHAIVFDRRKHISIIIIDRGSQQQKPEETFVSHQPPNNNQAVVPPPPESILMMHKKTGSSP